jgi:hypothetical protein
VKLRRSDPDRPYANDDMGANSRCNGLRTAAPGPVNKGDFRLKFS